MNQTVYTGQLQQRLDNTERIRSVLMEKGPLSKPELAEMTGLSTVTAGAIIHEMEESGEAVRAGQFLPERGRPSVMYAYNYSYRYTASILSFREGGDRYFSLIISDMTGEPLTRRTLTADELRPDSFDRELEKNMEKISALCFCAPGFQEPSGTIISAKDDTVELYLHIRNRFPFDVHFINDVNAAAFGEADDKEILCAVYLPDEGWPGAAFIQRGHIYEGATEFAGEISNLPVPLQETEETKEKHGKISPAAAAYFVIVYCCVLAPDRIIMFGESLTDELIQLVRNNADDKIGKRFHCKIERLNSLAESMEKGSFKLAFSVLREKLRKGIGDEYR